MKVFYVVATTRRPNRDNLVGRIAGWKRTPSGLPITVHHVHPIDVATE